MKTIEYRVIKVKKCADCPYYCIPYCKILDYETGRFPPDECPLNRLIGDVHEDEITWRLE